MTNPYLEGNFAPVREEVTVGFHGNWVPTAP